MRNIRSWLLTFRLFTLCVVNKSQGSFERYRAEQFPQRPRKFVRPKNGDLYYIHLSSAAGIAETHLNLHSIPVSNHRRAEPGGGKNNDERGTGFSRDCGMSSCT